MQCGALLLRHHLKTPVFCHEKFVPPSFSLASSLRNGSAANSKRFGLFRYPLPLRDRNFKAQGSRIKLSSLCVASSTRRRRKRNATKTPTSDALHCDSSSNSKPKPPFVVFSDTEERNAALLESAGVEISSRNESPDDPHELEDEIQEELPFLDFNDWIRSSSEVSNEKEGKQQSESFTTEQTAESKLPVLAWEEWSLSTPEDSIQVQKAGHMPTFQIDSVQKHDDKTRYKEPVQATLLQEQLVSETENHSNNDSSAQHNNGHENLDEHEANRWLYSGRIGKRHKNYFRRLTTPCEEPWLEESIYLQNRIKWRQEESRRNKKLGLTEHQLNSFEEGENGEEDGDEEVQTRDFEDEEDEEEYDDEEEDEESEEDGFVEMYMNDSLYSRRRLAVVTDGNLSELIFGSFDSEVQVGSVYLGVIKKLIPAMRGAFVDIGMPQLAFMEYTSYRCPFTFPSIQSEDEEEEEDEEDEEKDEYEGEEENEMEIEEFESTRLMVENTKKNNVEGEDKMDGFEEEEVEEGKEHQRKMNDIEEIQDEDGEANTSHWENEDESEKSNVLIRKYEDEDGGNVIHHEENETRERYTKRERISVSKSKRRLNRYEKWEKLKEGMLIIVQVKKEALRAKGPRLTAFPNLAGRLITLVPRLSLVGVSAKLNESERTKLRTYARELKPDGFGCIVRTEAKGSNKTDLEKDLIILIKIWGEILQKSSRFANSIDHGKIEPKPVLLYQGTEKIFTVIRDLCSKVSKLVVDSERSYREVKEYLNSITPSFTERIELYTRKEPIFDFYKIEPQINQLHNNRVSLPNGGYIIIEETEALVSIDVNGGIRMMLEDKKHRDEILAVNLEAARCISNEIKLRDLGGIIIIDFIDMEDESHNELVYKEMKKHLEKSSRPRVQISEISSFGVMEMTRKRVRTSVSRFLSEECPHCSGRGRVESKSSIFSRIERAVKRHLASKSSDESSEVIDVSSKAKWPKILLRVDNETYEYVKKDQSKLLELLSSSLNVILTVRSMPVFQRGQIQLVDYSTPLTAPPRKAWVPLERRHPFRPRVISIPSPNLLPRKKNPVSTGSPTIPNSSKSSSSSHVNSTQPHSISLTDSEASASKHQVEKNESTENHEEYDDNDDECNDPEGVTSSNKSVKKKKRIRKTSKVKSESQKQSGEKKMEQ